MFVCALALLCWRAVPLSALLFQYQTACWLRMPCILDSAFNTAVIVIAVVIVRAAATAHAVSSASHGVLCVCVLVFAS
jgi:hypothetical protein